MERLHLLPPELLSAILQWLDASDLCHARLACRALADAGLRSLVPTVTVGRSPASFEKAQLIQNDPVLRFYVKKVVYISDQIKLHPCSFVGKNPEDVPALQQFADGLAEFQASGQDIESLKRLLQGLPALVSVSFESPHLMSFRKRTAACWRLSFPAPGIFCKLAKPTTASIIQAVKAIDAISSLHIVGAPIPIIQHEPPQYFDHLLRLNITFQRDVEILNLYVDKNSPRLLQHHFPLLTHLRLCGKVDTFDIDHLPLSFALPATLKELQLDGVRFLNLELPPKLERLSLKDVRLTETDMSGWVSILAQCTMDCEFSGHFMAKNTRFILSCIGFCNCRNTLMDTTLGICLASICSPNCSAELRTDVLQAAFNNNAKDYFYRKPQHISVPDSLAERYRQFSSELGNKKTSTK